MYSDRVLSAPFAEFHSSPGLSPITAFVLSGIVYCHPALHNWRVMGGSLRRVSYRYGFESRCDKGDHPSSHSMFKTSVSKTPARSLKSEIHPKLCRRPVQDLPGNPLDSSRRPRSFTGASWTRLRELKVSGLDPCLPSPKPTAKIGLRKPFLLRQFLAVRRDE